MVLRSNALADLGPLERSTLSEKVAQVITDGLLQGRFRPGDRLVENDLAELLGVSRSPIREALTELSNSGLVTRLPGRGAAIRKWSVKDLQDLHAVRAVLEGQAALLVFDARDRLDLSVLEEVVEPMAAVARAGDFGRMIELDLAFHHRLWALADNRLLEQVLQGLSLQFRLFLTLNWRFHGGLDRVQENHRRIIRCLKGPSRETLSEAMSAHVVVEHMIRGLETHVADAEDR